MTAWTQRSATVQIVGQEIHRNLTWRFDHNKFESGRTPLKQPRKSNIFCDNVNPFILFWLPVPISE
jgi:hypothetical protein